MWVEITAEEGEGEDEDGGMRDATRAESSEGVGILEAIWTLDLSLLMILLANLSLSFSLSRPFTVAYRSFARRALC